VATYCNEDGVLVVDAGAVVLESTTVLGEDAPDEESDDVVRDSAGE
jgi:formylmethanofuran dehydrogenase subunit A